MIKQVSQVDLVRLMEIEEQMLALLLETEFLLDGSSKWRCAWARCTFATGFCAGTATPRP
jgi:hypothetical protein